MDPHKVGEVWLRAAAACWYLGMDYRGNGPAPSLARFDVALRYELQARENFYRWANANPQSRYVPGYIGLIEGNTGLAFARLKRFREARPHFEAALRSFQHAIPDDATDERYTLLAHTYYTISLLGEGDVHRAFIESEAANRLSVKEMASDPGNLCYRLDGAIIQGLRGRVQYALKNPQLGARLLDGAITNSEKIVSKDAGYGPGRAVLVMNYLSAADGAALSGNRDQARRRYRQAAEIARGTLAAHPEDGTARADLARALVGLSK